MKKEIEEKIGQLGGIVPIGDSFLPVADAELKAIEADLGNPLPAEYRAFLKKYGASAFSEYVGFQPMKPLPHTLSSTGKGLFSCFYGAANERHNSLARKIKTFRGRMPDTIFPIGHDSGNQICLGINGEEKGKVYYWDHHNEWDEEDYRVEHGMSMPPEVRFQNVYLVAESFEDFIRRLENWEPA